MYQHLGEYCPQLAKEETRTLRVDDEGQVQDYTFLEFFCPQPDCDCHQVVFHVLKNSKKLIASIGYGFAPGVMSKPFLDPFSPQSEESEDMLSLCEEVLLQEPGYVARLKRHYALFKEAVAARVFLSREERWAKEQAESQERLKKRRKLKRSQRR